ncbi:MAG TPA: IS4 family transposase [Rubrivivax sp.]|nr:IS4 family transposase [Rubrivivax sp.]HPO19215.1 IS4 family transposase [Rubrivivax sp.]
MGSPQFAERARHPDFPHAFTRRRQLPVPALVAALLSMRAGSQQAMLDEFYASLLGESGLVRAVSDRAFAQARQRLHMPALTWLNEQLLDGAQRAQMVPRWCGFRLVAADASVLMPAVRPCHRTASAASTDQRLFALYLPGAELTLHAAVHGACESERAMLMESLAKLGADDVLLLDRGYPAAWLVQVLQQRGIRFVMRCDNDSGWPAVRSFVRSARAEVVATLNVPSARDAQDWGCARVAPSVRLVRHVAPGGAIRVLATNLGAQEVAAVAFGDLYHRRWRIEEAFKRLKHRLHLEAVSGLSQQALIIDVAAKVLADNIAALLCAAALNEHPPTDTARRCNRSYAARFVQRALPSILLMVGDVIAAIAATLRQLAANTQRFRPGRSRPRSSNHVKPHACYAYKG